MFAYANHGKRGVTLDPTTPTGTTLLRRLLAQSQVLVQSQPAALLETLGLNPAALRDLNPALIDLSVTARGRNCTAHASDLTITHYAAYAFHQARPVQSPEEQPPVAGADREAALATGVAAAAAALWGILGAEQDFAGTSIDCAQADVMAHLLIEPVADYGRGERDFGRRRADLRGTEIAGGLVGLLPCSDGLVMVSPREQHQWDRWVGLIGNPAWAQDTDLCGTRAARTTHWARLQDEMSVWTRRHTREEVFMRAQAARVASFPVSTPRDLLDNPQLHARGFFDHTADGLAMPGLPFALRTSTGRVLERERRVTTPALGEANPDILQDILGLSRPDCEALRRHGIA
jgi:crotonobetainyl-CoA:carnitine CoA-transferase CaiB-like acyl-CoA transferase